MLRATRSGSYVRVGAYAVAATYAVAVAYAAVVSAYAVVGTYAVATIAIRHSVSYIIICSTSYRFKSRE